MVDMVNVKIMDDEERLVNKNTTLFELSKKYENRFYFPIILAKVNNELQELHRTLVTDSTVKFLDITDANGFRAYQRSVVFLLIYATKKILGKKTRLIVEHSINKNYYCEIDKEDVKITDELLESIENCMQEAVKKDLPIEKNTLNIEECLTLSKEFGLEDKILNLKFRRTGSVNFYKLDWFYDYFYGQLVPSTGYLNIFKLSKQSKGFILRFPDSNNHKEISNNWLFKKMSKVFLESSQWAKILNIDIVGALNERISQGDVGNIIRISEALHEKKIASIADMIYTQKKEIIMIAGPSSSGKTTFAERLSIQLRVNGLIPHIISIDDYFKNQVQTPHEAEEFDFESINAVDVERLNNDLKDILNGELVAIPSFNFVSGKRENKGRFLKLDKNGVIIVEGIHALNEKITNVIDKEKRFKIFISALTQLNIDDHNRIPTSDTRLLRRIIRDARFRKLDPLATIKMWPSVIKGEGLNIFPYQETADVIFNSALVYELSIVKQFVEPILFGIDKTEEQYTEAKRLIKFLDSFLGISSEEVPSNSIIREFIGGSCFHT